MTASQRQDDELQLNIRLPVRSTMRWFLLLLTCIVGMNLFLGFLKVLDLEQDEQPLRSLTYLFDVGEELAVIAWISTLLLFIASLACLAAAQRAAQVDNAIQRRGFRIQAVVLLYISLDEATELHERTTDPLRDFLGAGGFLYWTWVVPAIALVALVALVLLRFVRSLPSRLRNAMFASGVLFVICALGLELLEGYFFERAGEQGTVTTDLLSLTEETGEMVAVAIALWAALTYANTPPGSPVTGTGTG